VPIDKVRECQDAFLEKIRSAHPEIIETLANGKIDNDISNGIEAIMQDIAGTFA
jgi:F-type H+-transporting ATPase subunit alpha